MSTYWNMAADAVHKEGDRRKAEVHYEQAEIASKQLFDPADPNAYVLGWQAMILYNRGVNLLHLHSLVAVSPIPSSKMPAAKKIAKIWDDFMDVTKPLDAQFCAFFQQKHQFDIEGAKNSVRHDPIFRRSPVFDEDMKLLRPWA